MESERKSTNVTNKLTAHEPKLSGRSMPFEVPLVSSASRPTHTSSGDRGPRDYATHMTSIDYGWSHPQSSAPPQSSWVGQVGHSTQSAGPKRTYQMVQEAVQEPFTSMDTDDSSQMRDAHTHPTDITSTPIPSLLRPDPRKSTQPPASQTSFDLGSQLESESHGLDQVRQETEKPWRDKYVGSRTTSRTTAVKQAEPMHYEQAHPPEAALPRPASRRGVAKSHHFQYNRQPERSSASNPVQAPLPSNVTQPSSAFQRSTSRGADKAVNSYPSHSIIDAPQAVDNVQVNRGHYGRDSRRGVKPPVVEERGGHYGERIRTYFASPQQLPTPDSDAYFAQRTHRQRVLQADTSLDKAKAHNYIHTQGYQGEPTTVPNVQAHKPSLPTSSHSSAGNCPIISRGDTNRALSNEPLQFEREQGALARRVQELGITPEFEESQPPNQFSDIKPATAEKVCEQNRHGGNPTEEGSKSGIRGQDTHEYAEDAHPVLEQIRGESNKGGDQTLHTDSKSRSTTTTEPRSTPVPCIPPGGAALNAPTRAGSTLPRVHRAPTPAPADWGQYRAPQTKSTQEEDGRKRSRTTSDANVDMGYSRVLSPEDARGAKKAKQRAKERGVARDRSSRKQRREEEKQATATEKPEPMEHQSNPEQTRPEKRTPEREDGEDVHGENNSSRGPSSPLFDQHWASNISYGDILPPPPPPRHRVSLVGPWSSYEQRWSELSVEPPTSQLRFRDIPWPLPHIPTGPASITPDLVCSFILSFSHSTGKSRKKRIREALLHWNPDKFERRWMAHIEENERSEVKIAVDEVYLSLIQLLRRDHDKNLPSRHRRLFIPFPQALATRPPAFDFHFAGYWFQSNFASTYVTNQPRPVVATSRTTQGENPSVDTNSRSVSPSPIGIEPMVEGSNGDEPTPPVEQSQSHSTRLHFMERGTIVDSELVQAIDGEQELEMNIYGDGPREEPISRQMLAPEVISHLVTHGCQDLTRDIDHDTFNDHPSSNGGFSDVYCGQLLDGRKVAIKALRIALRDLSPNRPKHMKQSARELHTWSKCNHPNVLPLLGLAEFRGRIGMVSPWMGQGSLPRYLNRMPSANRRELCVQICDGLAYLHEIGIVHGDLKGANVLVSDEGVPVITDFGNSLNTNQSMRFTQTTTQRSLTVRWTAPELVAGPGEPTEASDVYALAMTIYEIMAGTIPYPGKTDNHILSYLLYKWEAPERPRGIPIGHADGDKLWDLLGRCWAFEPETRPSASEVASIMRTINPNGLGPVYYRNI